MIGQLYLIHMYKGTITPDESGSGSNGNEAELYIL